MSVSFIPENENSGTNKNIASKYRRIIAEKGNQLIPCCMSIT
jgi:hypothetical protein